MKKIIMPYEAKYIIDTLNKAGFEAYIVGGCVRDEIMGLKPKDWDITTSAPPEDVKKIFKHTVDTGIKHGTVTVVLNKLNFEVTTYRIDGEYADFRHPEEVEFTKNLKDDLCRRDFTMNAVAYSDSVGYMDFFDGIGDIGRKLIRGVGDAGVRFNEDALRMMRAVRFSAQLDFDIEENTFLAIKENAHLIKNVSAERIREELFKLILSDSPERFVLLKISGLSEFVFPEVNGIDEKRLHILLKAVKKCRKNISERLSVIFTQLGEEAAGRVLKRLKSDNRTIKEVCTIIKVCGRQLRDDRRETRHIIGEVGEDIFKSALSVLFNIKHTEGNLYMCKVYDNIYDEIEETVRKGYCTSLKTLAVNGEILNENGVENGKMMGVVLKKALNYVLDNPEENTKEILISKIHEWTEEFI